MTPEEYQKEIESRTAVFDCNSATVISQAGRKLLGECSRCGGCCKFGKDGTPRVPYPDFAKKCCSHLKYIEDSEGNTITMCDIYRIRPVYCALFPEITDFENNQVPEECTLHYEE